MRFYFTKNSELVPFVGNPSICERIQCEYVEDAIKQEAQRNALVYIDHPNLLYLDPSCNGLFDRMGYNPYLVSVASFKEAEHMTRRFGSDILIMRRIDYRYDGSVWLDCYKIRLNIGFSLTRKAMIDQFLEEN